jgi:ribosomal protein L19E
MSSYHEALADTESVVDEVSSLVQKLEFYLTSYPLNPQDDDDIRVAYSKMLKSIPEIKPWVTCVGYATKKMDELYRSKPRMSTILDAVLAIILAIQADFNQTNHDSSRADFGISDASGDGTLSPNSVQFYSNLTKRMEQLVEDLMDLKQNLARDDIRAELLQEATIQEKGKKRASQAGEHGSHPRAREFQRRPSGPRAGVGFEPQLRLYPGLDLFPNIAQRIEEYFEALRCPDHHQRRDPKPNPAKKAQYWQEDNRWDDEKKTAYNLLRESLKEFVYRVKHSTSTYLDLAIIDKMKTLLNKTREAVNGRKPQYKPLEDAYIELLKAMKKKLEEVEQNQELFQMVVETLERVPGSIK